MAILHAISATLVTIGGLFSMRNVSNLFDCYSCLKMPLKQNIVRSIK